MKRLWKFLVAAAFVVAAIVSTPHNAFAIDWCAQCDASGDCFACCRCDGHGAGYCAFHC